MLTPRNCPASDARRTRRLLASFALLLGGIVLASSACGTSSSTGAVAPPIPTSTPAPEWVTYTVQGDARIDIPGVLQLDRSSAPVGHGILGWHDDQYPLSPDHPAAAEVIITLDAAVVTDGAFPCRSGTRITVGPGITGYQSDNTTLITYADCFAPPPPGEVRAFWITAGVCYELRMSGGYASASAQTFMTRYGTIWQHMLASFVPPPPPVSGDTTCS